MDPYDFLSAPVGLREDGQYLPHGTTNQQLKGICPGLSIVGGAAAISQYALLLVLSGEIEFFRLSKLGSRAFIFMQDVAVVPYQFLLFHSIRTHFRLQASNSPGFQKKKLSKFHRLSGAIFQEACFLGGTEGLEAWKN